MTGETQHVYTISDAEAGPKEQDKDFGFEGCGEKDGRGEGTSPFPATKDKEPHSQREAVIRPQQAGKIDFKSLHNKPKFAGESGWGGIKGSPQSPPGKGRARERSRRAGKGERGQHQLYRLSIASARPSPTIGIAYPQQKVTPPKVPETSRAPAAGSYRFHVPGVPEEEKLSFGRCFPEAAAGRTSANYTSPPAGPPRPPHGPKGQPPAGIPLKSPGTNGQLHYLEFQANGASSWPSPEKSFAGASYGVKPSSFPEGGKAGGHALGALPFQFPFQLLHDSGKEPYRGDAEYLDVALAAGQAAHGAFGFHASPREWQEEAPGIGSFEGACPPGRLYGVPTPLLAPPPAPHRGPLPCYKGRSEHPADPSGALSSSGAIDQNPSTFQENQAVFPSSLHSPSVPKPVGKGQASAKDSVPSPRLLLPGSPLRRNMPPNSLSQVHFQSKAFCSSPAGSASAGPVPFETSVPTTAPTHPRLVQAWEGAAKAFSPVDQNSAPYPNPVGSQFSFECQPGPEQRQHRQKNARMPWQQIHLASAVPGQNRIELSRQMSGQKLPFPLGTPEWPGSKAHKGSPLNSSPGYHGKKLLSGESLGAQRGDPGLAGAFSFENGKDPASPACDSRSKALFYSMGQAGPPPPPSRSSSGSALVLPPSALVAASPCGSPLPSPVPNPACGSTCSSLSPVSSSPLNPSFEDGQLPGALAPSPFFHHPCHPKEGGKTFHPSEVLTSGSLHYHPQDSIKPFHFPPDALKDDHLLKCSPESPFHKAGAEVAKSCLDGLDGEPPPPPPPPYASHHLLAGSLSSASLDQLDVLLTCKQCDQNYSNLASFLEHRQFCASHPAPHAEAKDPPRVAEGRRGLPPELPKPPATTGASLPLSPDPQAHLLALNKGEEFLLDGESKSDGKEDALKGGLFNGLAASSLPLTASDLDIDDAKLDSLITEALNGLGYQSDNPEIDSSFIDVFADEELTGMKAAGSGASHKAKEALASESKPRHAAAEEKEGCCDEDSHTVGERAKRRAGKQHGHKGRAARRLVAREAERTEPAAEERTARLRVGRKNSVPAVSSRAASGQKQPKKHSQEPQMKSEAGQGAAAKSSKPPRFSMKEGKKRKPRSGTWSKELIHKIVQQKNKLHQLHAKSSKQAQPPLHHERLEPPSQEGRLQEYDYVSDSEDEGAACSRLRGRRKRGAAFMGRAKYSFSKKRPGRGERAKEKDPAWSYSRRRDRQKREAPGHRRGSSPEAAKKGDCAGRARRRSSQSSTGSNPSVSVATKAGPTDLVGEKAAGMGRRRSGSPARTPRAVLSHPEDRSPKKSQKSKEDVSRGPRQVGSAKPLLASPRSHLNTAPDASAGDDAKEEPLPPSQEGQLPSTATSGRSPIRLPHKKEAEEPKGAVNQAGEGSPEAQDSAGLAMVGQRQQFAPYTGDTVKYHAEELMAPSRSEPSPSGATAAFSGAGSKYGKAHGVADGGKGFAAPGAPFGGDAVGMMLAAKAPDPYVGSDSAFFDPKGLPAHYDANLFSKPPALGSSHMDEMYLCREDIGTGSFEQKHASISPYTAETPQTKVSSPLSFDSSSIFGELPVTEFDSPLYESVSAGKDGYVAAFACPSSAPSKPLPFEQPYPPFMPEKDWSLMEEVAPMLPEDMAHFHGLAVDKPLAKKFPEEGAVPPAPLPLPLPDRMTDYNVAFINNMSDDELEIKRLVTELESQLQTSKLSGEAPSALPKGEHHPAAPLRGSAAEPFPPLPADQGHQKGLFMADELGSSSLLATKVCAGERLGGEKPAVTGARGGYEGGREPWHGPAAAFGSLDAGMCTPPPSDGFCPKESGEQLQGAVATEGSGPRRMENESSSKSPPNPRAPDTAEVPIYTDAPPKSPPAVPNARMVEATEANEDTLTSLQGAESFPVPGKPGERFGDAAELEKFDAHLPNHNPELGFQPGPATAMDLPFSPHIKEVPDAEERPFGKSKEPQMVKSALDFKGDGGGSALLEEAEERKSPAALPAPGHSDKASKHKALLFHMLSLPKESSSQRTSASQDANPLQQLQLFVARTVKSNEEELLMPCFPMLLAPGHPAAASKGQQEQKEESASFRSKPGLTRHKAVKHQVKPSKPPRSALIPADETSRAAQKVPRRSLKAVREKTCGSQVPNAAEHAPKKMCTGLEKEPSAQMQEVVSRVLSDLSVISLEVSQELHRTRVAHREMKAKGQRAETGAGEDPGRQGRKGEKGRRSQSKDPGGVNGNSERKLNRKVRRRKAKAFPSRHEPDGPCELGKSSGPAPAALSPSLPAVTEGLREPGGCISTEEQNLPNSSPPKAKQSPCAAELAEDPGDRMVPSEEVSKEPGTGTDPCPEGEEEPGEAESTQACRAWVGGFVKQVEEGLGEVGEEQHRDGTEEMEAETGGSSGGSGAGKWSSAPGGVTSPAPGVPNVQTNDLETPQKAPTHGALQPPPAASPAPAEPKRWAKAELTPSREHHGDNAATSDLQGLFDDDPTFSQLFPRDEQLIRRKCTRVYGKRSKKPKPVAEVSLRPAGAIDLFSIRLASDLSDTGSFCVTREDPCEYETISIDDALMLNMCHGSKARSGEAGPGGSASTALRSDGEKASPGRDVTDLEDNMLTFLCQNRHMDNGPSLSIWAGLEKEGESLAAEGMFEAPVGLENEHSLGETSSEPPDLVEEPYDGKSSEDSDSPEFHTIDIEMLNAKLKMRDVCFFGSCEELPGSGDDGASSFKPKPGQHSKHGRSKLEDGKLGKNRGDITIKAKDKQYKCKVCFQWFLTLGELDFHKLTHNPSPPPTCYMCVQRKFSSREQLRDHLKEKHAKNKAGLWACGMCLKEISDVWMYNEHLREHATQFARKGQAQKSVMGLPACFGEDNDAVTQFLNTIMCRKPSRSSRHAEPSSKHTPSRESRSPRELPPEQEVKAVKEPSESGSVKVKPPAPSSSKASASPSPEHPAKSEGTPKSVPMHPDCKDPSRDCHHCGKQFPKPFKLQRHLVVHSLQKIYLCHKCPMFYQETKELRNHLSQEHGIVEEQEIKHTTLYACELCADVMHVIKKSFICSMCNYTFSKKEQYDRHMEKHLAGSNRTFKFRGVMRPGAASKEGREKVREDGVPPSKKRKVAPHGTSADRLGHAGDLQLVDPASPSLQPPSEPFPVAPRDPAAPLPQPPVKTEDLVGDFSDLLAEMEKSQFDALPPPPCLSPSLPQAAAGGAELGHIAALSIEELEKGAFDGKTLPFLDSPGFSLDLAGLACSQATDQKLSPPHLTEKRGYADAHKRTSTSNKDEYIAGGLENPDAATDAVDGIPFLQLAKKVSELPSQGAEAPPAKETHRTQWGSPSASEASCWEGASKATSPEAAHQPLPLKDKTASPALNRAAKDLASQKKTTGNQPGGEAAPEEGQQGSMAKDKSAPDGGTKESSAGTRDHGGNPSRSSGHQLRGDSAGHTAKLHPKRRKEHKSLSHRGSAGSRENMEGDGKKKKGRAPGPGRSESSGELKRADWSIAETPALSPGRRDAHGNRLLPKPKMGTQLKKMVLDACNQKKGELRHANGDVRRRKAILGKSLHQVLAKGTAPAPRSSLHGTRPARGTKPAGSASYRTAESQNNLLSQLFGQKLTSFKIPLRRETSE
ncbi:Zinc finger protein 469 [Aix galericulata]|nr:Zinc finger protein 469 [Aix galericulata]